MTRRSAPTAWLAEVKAIRPVARPACFVKYCLVGYYAVCFRRIIRNALAPKGKSNRAAAIIVAGSGTAGAGVFVPSIVSDVLNVVLYRNSTLLIEAIDPVYASVKTDES